MKVCFESMHPLHANIPFLTLWKRQKVSSFLKFSGVIEMEHWCEMSYKIFQVIFFVSRTFFF